MSNFHRQSWDRWAGLLLVLSLHGAGLYALWQHQIRVTPQEAVTLFVNFINPPPPVKQEEPPKPKPEPIIEAPPAPPEPVRLVTELAVSCPKRTPPVYPAASRRMGEEGRVVLWVELDEQGRVNAARVETRSGSERLDDAALAAVKTWQCTPATRDGAPVRAIALQPFVFNLEGR